MTVSIYAKNSVPDLSYVEANSTVVSVCLKMPFLTLVFNYMYFGFFSFLLRHLYFDKIAKNR